MDHGIKTNYTGDKIPLPPPTPKSGHKSNLFPWHKSILCWRCFREFMVPFSVGDHRPEGRDRIRSRPKNLRIGLDPV
jgi:hypothetical protein